MIADGLRRTPADGGAALELLGRARAARVRQPVVARLHHDRHEPQPGRRDPVPARPGLHRRRRLGLARRRSATRFRATGRRAACAATPQAIAELQESNVHSFQRPDAAHLELRSDPDVAQRLLRRSWRSARSAASACASTPTSRSRAPASTATTSGSCGAPTSATMSNWLQWRNDRPNKYLRSFRFNLNQWAGWNFGGDLLNSGGNVNAHAVFPNNWATGVGRQRQRARRSTIARPAAGLARTATRSAACGPTCRATSAGACRPASTSIRANDGLGTHLPRLQPGA